MELGLKRYAICKSCDNLNKTNAMCNQCNCFMRIKCLIPSAKCPLGKWMPVSTAQEKKD